MATPRAGKQSAPDRCGFALSPGSKDRVRPRSHRCRGKASSGFGMTRARREIEPWRHTQAPGRQRRNGYTWLRFNYIRLPQDAGGPRCPPLRPRAPYATILVNKVRFASMTVGLAVGVTAAVVVACTAAAYVYSKHHFRALLEDARASALSQGELIRVALEHQMIENDRTLIAQMIESFRAQARLEQLAVLDRNGVERFSSGAHTDPAEF